MVKKALSKQKNVENFADVLRYTRSHVQIKKHVQIKSESLIFYPPFLPVQISTVCGSSTTINSTCWGTSEDLSLVIIECLLCSCKQRLWPRIVAKKVIYIL